MGEVKSIEERVADIEKLLGHVQAHIVDVQDEVHIALRRVNDYQGRVDKDVSDVHQFVSDSVNRFVQTIYKEVRKRFSEEIAKEAFEKMLPETIAKALASKVLVTRPATREELKSGEGVLAVRQASREELKQN
jgi:archaellum component FlaC